MMVSGMLLMQLW